MTQFVALPALTLGNFLLSGDETFIGTFVIIFPLLMLVDFATMRLAMAPPLIVHHIVCVICHFYAIVIEVGVQAYFAGVFALEIGSGAISLFTFAPQRMPPGILLAMMTASNLGCLVCTARWYADVLASARVAGAYGGTAVSILLASLRQKEIVETCRRARAEAMSSKAQ